MDYLKILILIAFASLAWCGEVDDGEQKKRGAGKPSALNAIPTGAQKPEYTYSIYQNPNGQNTQSYAPQQLSSSFYPTQPGSQYYSPGGLSPEQSSVYPPQPQLNLIPPQTSQFVPLNFVPNSGYQSKYQIIPSKTANGNIQLAIIQPSVLQPPGVVYPQSLFSPQAGATGLPQQSAPYSAGYQPLSLASPYVNQPSMLLLQPGNYNPGPPLYQNSVPNLYNYYQQSPQLKYGVVYGGSQGQAPPADYEKLQGPLQGPPKEDNEIGVQPGDYLSPAESAQTYKNSYVTSRTSYKN